MRWPFVSRQAHEILAESLKQERLHTLWYQTQARLYQDMLVKPTDPVLAASTVVAERKDSFLQQAIREQSQGDPRLRQYLSTYAAKLKRENPDITDEERALAVSTWSSTEPDTTVTE
jgi:hypothetical protein